MSMSVVGEPHSIPAVPRLPDGSSPTAIRAALLAEEREEFDRDYRGALAEATDSLDLTGVLDILERWRCRAIVSADPTAYRNGLRRAAQLLSGEDMPEGESLAAVKERLAQFGI